MQIPNIPTTLSLLRSSLTVDEAVKSIVEDKSSEKGHPSYFFALGVLQACASLSPNDFSKIVQLDQKIIEISPDIAGGLYKVAFGILVINQATSFEDRTEVINKVRAQLDTSLAVQNQFHVLQYLDLLTPEIRSKPEVIKGCLNLCKLSNMQHQTLLHRLTHSLPVQKGIILSAFEKLSEEECVDVIENAFSTLSDDTVELDVLITLFSEITTAERKEITSIIHTHFSNDTNACERVALVRALRNISSECREEAIRITKAILPNLGELYSAQYILPLLACLSKENLTEELAAKLIPFLDDIYGDEIYFISDAEVVLKILGSLPLQGCTALMEKIRTSFSSLTNCSIAQRNDIVRIASSIPQEHCDSELINHIISLLSDIESQESRDWIIGHIESVDNESRRLMINITAPILINTSDAIIRADLLRVITCLRQNNWTAQVVQRIFVLLLPLNSEDRFYASLAISFLAYDDQITSIDLLTEAIQKNGLAPSNSLPFLLSVAEGHQQRREHCYESISQHMKSTEIEIATDMAKLVVYYQDFLLLHENDPLFQEAIAIETVTDETELADPKNPYRVYQKLKSFENTPLEHTPPLEEVCGKHVRFSPAGLQKLAQENALKVKFKELPLHPIKPNTRIEPTTLIELFAQIDQRLSNLAISEREELKNALTFEYSYDILKNNFLEGYIPTLLSIKGSSEDFVPLDAAKFFAILLFILKQSDQQAQGQLVSPQEETLLKISTSITSCPSGKQEGIDLAYQMLPQEDQIYGKIELDSGILQAKKALHEEIQSILLPLFSSDNAFMKEITGTPVDKEVVQLSHQSIYAKNSIGIRMGLDHSVKFDLSTGVVTDTLIQNELPALLETGFRHFTPKETVKRVARGITKRFKALEEKDEASKSSKSVAKPFFNQLNGLTNNIKLANEPLWSLDEESYKVTDCTEYGALNFLEGAGYLVSPTENENVVTGKKRDFSDFDCQNTDQ